MRDGDVSTLFAQLPPMTDREGRVLSHLVASSMGHTTMIGIPNLQRRLASPKTGKPASRSSIQRAIRRLEALGVIVPAKRGPLGVIQYRIVVPKALSRGAAVAGPPALQEGPPPPSTERPPALVQGPNHSEYQKEYQAETAGDPSGRPTSAIEEPEVYHPMLYHLIDSKDIPRPIPAHVLAEMRRLLEKRGGAA